MDAGVRLRQAALAPDEDSGTDIRFWPDTEIFSTDEFRFDTLAERLRELAYLNRRVFISLEDHRDAEIEREEYHYEGGIREFITYLDEARTPILQEVIYIAHNEAAVPVEVAMRYNTGFTSNVLSFVNNINTHEGGTHISGFRGALTRTLKTYAERNNLLKNFKGNLSGEDFREGLTAVISVMVAEPQFEGQTKTKPPRGQDNSGQDLAGGGGPRRRAARPRPCAAQDRLRKRRLAW